MATITDLSDSISFNNKTDKETDPLLASLRKHPCLNNETLEAPALQIENLSKVSGHLLINAYYHYLV